MPGRASDLIVIPDSFWQRAETTAALRHRDIGRIFGLLRQYAGASQTQIGIACGMNQGKVSAIVRGVQQVETLAVFERIADGLAMPDPARIILGLAPRATSRAPASARQRPLSPTGDTESAVRAARVDGLPGFSPQDGQEDQDPVRRRTFTGITAATIFSALIADSASSNAPLNAEPLAPVLAGHTDDAPRTPPVTAPDLAALAEATSNARRQYQACRYAELITSLPNLLAELHEVCHTIGGRDRLHAYALSADAHHVAAGLLLKLDDQGLASVAADRSMSAAQASEDPVTVGASARIVTHALMAGGHLPAAVSVASNHAAQLDREVPAHNPASLSVYGSLLLRGAVAAAQCGRRGTADALLAEAESAGKRIGMDGNLRWTAFGPTNATLHRVNIAVTLGDAGTAIEVARHVGLAAIPVTERRAALLIDAARAFLQLGKHEKAYLALRAAEGTAHEEVAGRPAVRRLVHELVSTAPPTVRRDAEEFARQIGTQQ